METVTNTKIKDKSWTQTSVSFSGLGLRKFKDPAVPAFFSAFHQSVELSNTILGKFNLNIMDDGIMNKLLELTPMFIEITNEQRKI